MVAPWHRRGPLSPWGDDALGVLLLAKRTIARPVGRGVIAFGMNPMSSDGGAAERAVAAATPLLQAAIAKRVTPGAVLQVAGLSGPGAAVARGAVAYGGGAVTLDTRYDLASVTKVTACLPSLLHLVEAGEVRLSDRVDRFFPGAGWMQEPSLGAVTVEDLALHRSGLPAWRPVSAWVTGHRAVLANVLQSSLSEPRGKNLYSDLGVIVLTAIIERAAGMPLEDFLRRQVLKPLGMTSTGFGPLAAGEDVAATEDDGLRGPLVGRVHDENADAMDGVSGHAGLFATAADLTRYAQAWLRFDAPFAGEELLRYAVSDLSQGEGARRGVIWRCAEEGWPFGSKVSARAFGHTGFTGTSVLVDPEHDLVVTLLTNRVHPRRGSANGVISLRHAVHDAVVEAFR